MIMGNASEIYKSCPHATDLKGNFPFEQCDKCPNKKYDDEEGLLYCKKVISIHE